MGKCRFNNQWLNNPDWTWLRRAPKDVHSAFCAICGKEFNIASMGITAVSTHARGKKHQESISTSSTSKLDNFFQLYPYEEVEEIAKGVLAQVKCRPRIGIICGSGLGGLADILENTEIILYKDIKGFPVSTVPGHAGRLVFGTLHGRQVVLMQGRAHLYEGYDVHKIILPVRVMKLMGVNILFVTNASGGINQGYNVGDIMIIKDHFNMPGFAAVNPLVGPNDDRFGLRFPPASQSYSYRLRQLVKTKAAELNMTDFIREGVYCFLGGPSFETVTECRFLKSAGVDGTGMSTVPEVLVATHCGMEVCGISLITNKCVMEYDSKQIANHEEVLQTSTARAKDLQKLIYSVIGSL